MRYELRAAAARDLDRAAEWYAENAIDPRVPIRFLLETRRVFETIAETPYAFPVVHGDVRRCRVLGFPAYSVFYRVRDDVVIVIAVLHGRRRPAESKRRP